MYFIKVLIFVWEKVGFNVKKVGLWCKKKVGFLEKKVVDAYRGRVVVVIVFKKSSILFFTG